MERDPARINWPNISDYWPDAEPRHRSTETGTSWQDLVPTQPSRRGRPPAAAPVESPGRSMQRPVLTALLAMLVTGGTVLLARPLADSEMRQAAPAPTTASPAATLPAVVLPAPEPSTTTPPPPAPPPSPVRTARVARFELVSGVTELSVRAADLDGRDFLVTSGRATFDDGVLRADGDGSGPVVLQLSNRITWHLRMSAGVKQATFDMSAGKVSRIDLDGGAERIDVSLGRLTGTVPIRMTGGAGSWHIRTTGRVPMRIAVRNGAGDVAVYGRHEGGTAAGAVIRSGDLDEAPGLNINATAGFGTLEITD